MNDCIAIDGREYRLLDRWTNTRGGVFGVVRKGNGMRRKVRFVKKTASWKFWGPAYDLNPVVRLGNRESDLIVVNRAEELFGDMPVAVRSEVAALIWWNAHIDGLRQREPWRSLIDKAVGIADDMVDDVVAWLVKCGVEREQAVDKAQPRRDARVKRTGVRNCGHHYKYAG